jgi:hypothetical protein
LYEQKVHPAIVVNIEKRRSPALRFEDVVLYVSVAVEMAKSDARVGVISMNWGTRDWFWKAVNVKKSRISERSIMELLRLQKVARSLLTPSNNRRFRSPSPPRGGEGPGVRGRHTPWPFAINADAACWMRENQPIKVWRSPSPQALSLVGVRGADFCSEFHFVHSSSFSRGTIFPLPDARFS